MSYYTGDFYRGDYYTGDPGFFDLIRRVGQKALPAAASLIPGGGIVSAGVKAAAGMASRGGAIVKRAGAVVAKHPVISAAGAAGTIGALGGMGAGEMMAHPALMGMGGMRGFHMTKAVHHGARYNPAPHLAKNRRMRVTNPKALRRAIRRAHGFARLAKKVLSFTSPRAHKGRPVFRRKRRRAA